MKFDLVWEYISHYTVCIILVGFCGMLMPTFIVMIGSGHLIVSTLNVPFFGFSEPEAKVLYGVVSFILFTVVTKAWMIEGCINEWISLHRLHMHAVDRLKFGPAYFRRRVAN